MSTAQLDGNAWMQSENTLAAAQSWLALDEQGQPGRASAAPETPRPKPAREPAPTLPDDFWQDWFGIWK